jgi:uncharacterized membrane protein
MERKTHFIVLKPHWVFRSIYDHQ